MSDQMIPQSAGSWSERPFRSWLAILAAISLILMSLWNIRIAHGLQGRLDQDYVVSYVREALREQMQAGREPQLQRMLNNLLRQPELNIKFLSVTDSSGVLLASAGKFENLAIGFLSAQASQKLRELLYEFSSDFGRAVVMQDDKALGSFDYAISSSLLGLVREAAVDRLIWSGWLGLLLGLLLLFWLRSSTRQLQIPNQAATALLGRLNHGPSGQTADASAVVPTPEVEMQIAQALRQRVGNALDQLNYGLVLTDRQGHVRYLNKIAEALTGWPLADARQRAVYSIFHAIGPQDEPLISAAEQSLQQGSQTTTIECRLRTRSGALVQIEMMASLLYATDGTVDGVSMLFRDAGLSHQKIEEYKRQSRLSQGVIDHLEEGLLTTDPAGVVRFANARAQRMFGYAREELEGVTVTKLMPVPFLNTPSIKLLDYSGGKASLKLPKVVGWRKDATTFPAELKVQQMNVGEDNGLIVIVRDISERLRSDNLASRLGRLLDSALEEVYIFDAQSLYFLEVNRGARKNLGYRQEQLSRMTPLGISSQIEEEDFLAYLARLRGGEAEHLSYRCLHKRSDGSEYPVEVRLNFSREEEPPVFMAIAVDISERLRAEQQLQHLAHHDALTDLPTRTVLYDRLRQALLAAARSNRMVAVYFVDLDFFKQINDRHGHEIGDAVLKCVSERLKGALRAADTVARISGDEFVIVANGVRGSEDAENLARKVVESFRERLDIPGEDIRVSVSVGVALYPLDESDADALLRHADSAMYVAKRGGRDGYRLYSADIDPDRRRRLDLEREIHAAVALNQYRLTLLPVTDDRDAVRAGLVEFYWEHPRYGRIEAAETLRAATRAGLLADLELWVICNSCMRQHEQLKAGVPVLPMIVGISGWQLRDPDFDDQLLYLIRRFEVAPAMLILTLSQDGLAEASTVPPERLEQLTKSGVRFALRDFSGSFDLLNRQSAVPFNLIVLPEDLAGSMLDDAEATAQVKRMLETAAATGHQVIVPGIASMEMRGYLKSLGKALIAGPLNQADLMTAEGVTWLTKRRIEVL